jgi:hypothetical protein
MRYRFLGRGLWLGMRIFEDGEWGEGGNKWEEGGGG